MGALRCITHSYQELPPDLSDCETIQDAVRPWFITIWEPLPTKAPSPPKAQPFFCYLNTVIFYVSPYIVRPWKRRYWVNGKLRACRGGFEEWDKIETRMTWGDVVEFQGQQFSVNGGSVIWKHKRWWMKRRVRLVTKSQYDSHYECNGHRTGSVKGPLDHHQPDGFADTRKELKMTKEEVQEIEKRVIAAIDKQFWNIKGDIDCLKTRNTFFDHALQGREIENRRLRKIVLEQFDTTVVE